jgi:hypothetical protein
MKMSAKDDAVICIENSTGNIYWKGKLVEGDDDFKSAILDWIRGTKNEQQPASCGCTEYEQQHCRADVSPFAENSGCVKLMRCQEGEN